MSRIERQNITVPVIIQAVGGDLRIKGRSGADLVVDGDGVRVEQIDDEQPYLVRSDGDCRVTVPGSINVIVQQVGGDAKLTDLGGITKIGAVGGDLTLRNLQGLQIDAVGGDLRIKWADGPVTIRAVGADATIREVRGNVSIDKVGADLYLRNIEGSCVVEQIGSDLVLSMDFAPGGEYRFRFEGRGAVHAVAIDLWDGGVRQLSTRLSGRAEPLDGRAMAKWLLRHPFMTLGVIARIHWQALRLAVRRARFHRKPAPPLEETT